MRASNAKFTSLVKLECSKAFRSLGFWVAFLIAEGIVGYFLWKHFTIGSEWMGELPMKNGWFYTGSAYGQWLGAKADVEKNVFLFLLPLLSALPYGASYIHEKEDGYIRQVVTRGDRKSYFFAKWIAVFCSGAAVIAIPMATSFLGIMLDTPLWDPLPISGLGANTVCPLTTLYYRHPMLYVLFYIIMDGLMAGSLASLTLIVAGFGAGSFVAWTFPMLLSLIMRYLAAPLDVFQWSPFTIVDPIVPGARPEIYGTIEIIGTAVLVWFLFVVRCSKKEVF